MKKLLFVLISVLLLASCSQLQNAYENTSVPPDAAVTDNAHTSPSPTPALPAPSPTQGFISCKKGERISEYFYTGDIERFFTMHDVYYDVYYYSDLGILFTYGPEELDDSFISYENEQEAVSLQSLVLSAFDFRGLNATSSFKDVTETLGESELLTIRGEDSYGEGYYYALRYIFDPLRFEFSSAYETGAGGLTLTVTPASESQVFYTSCKNGESVSKTLTTGDIKLIFKLKPEDLDNRIGNGYPTGDEDFGFYYIYFEYLGVTIAYNLGFSENEDFTEYPEPPVEFVSIDDFDYRGINETSTFKDVINELGTAKLYTEEYDGGLYCEIRYEIDGMQFVFSGSDEQASDGVSLCIYPG
jgi:hypothetical protein